MQIRKIKRQAQARKNKILYSKFRKALTWTIAILSLIAVIIAIWGGNHLLEIILSASIAVCGLLLICGPSEPTKEETTSQKMLDRMKPTRH